MNRQLHKEERFLVRGALRTALSPLGMFVAGTMSLRWRLVWGGGYFLLFLGDNSLGILKAAVMTAEGMVATKKVTSFHPMALDKLSTIP